MLRLIQLCSSKLLCTPKALLANLNTSENFPGRPPPGEASHPISVDSDDNSTDSAGGGSDQVESDHNSPDSDVVGGSDPEEPDDSSRGSGMGGLGEGESPNDRFILGPNNENEPVVDSASDLSSDDPPEERLVQCAAICATGHRCKTHFLTEGRRRFCGIPIHRIQEDHR
jgi:hypothetical protein